MKNNAQNIRRAVLLRRVWQFSPSDATAARARAVLDAHTVAVRAQYLANVLTSMQLPASKA